MTPEQLAATLALIGLVIVAASLLSGVVERTGLPQVAIFLALGALLGPAGLGLLDFTLESPALAIIATLALLLVLFSDAVTIDMAEVREQRRLAWLVIGPGTLLSATLIAVAGWALLGLSPAAAAILGASLASTDPVLLRSLLRRRDLPGTARVALRLESGMNDAVLLPIVAISMLALRPGAAPAREEVGRRVLELFVLGPGLGALVGWLAIVALDWVRARLPVRRDYESIYALGVAFTAYAAAEGVGGSGFLAGFAAGLVIASLDVELCDCFLDFGEASAEMFLLLTFVAFGTSLIWRGLTIIDARTLGFAVVALGVRTAVLLPLLARTGIDRGSRRLIAWVGPRGLSSLLLVLLPLFAGIPGAESLFTITALVVLISVVAHGGGIALFLRHPVPAPTAEVPTAEVPAPAAAAPAPAAALATALSAEPVTAAAGANGGAPVSADPERITIDEYQRLVAHGEPVIVVDARTDRTYRLDDVTARGAVRLPPDDAPRRARELGLANHATLVVYCA
ncbi:MAG TPA: cation:proton antiporter [Gemmatimonadaceae bacterium]|nr:cation:proton antiporter [Gemmatimonadaceae bacterium]